MTFKAYYDDEKIYFQFKVNCKSPKVFVKNNNKIEVVNSERVEIFLLKNFLYTKLQIDTATAFVITVDKIMDKMFGNGNALVMGLIANSKEKFLFCFRGI